MKWWKIESAPKDGTSIIALVPGFDPAIVEWVVFNGHGIWSPDPEMFTEEHYYEEYVHASEYKPLYWMPIDSLNHIELEK